MWGEKFFKLYHLKPKAEEFGEEVQTVREWLPQAEAELKFKALPEDEDAIIALIENHEKFQEELQAQQPKIERIKYLSDEILHSCHPNAVRFVKYYLTITHTRWEQVGMEIHSNLYFCLRIFAVFSIA